MAILVTITALAMSIVFFVVAGSFPSLAADPGGPALFPRIAAAITGTACILYCIQVYATRRTTLGSFVEELPRRLLAVIERRAQLASFALILFLPFAIAAVGFVLATLAFVVALMLISGISLFRTLITAVIVTAFIYAGYALLLGAVLPRGYLWS
jgi:putative tricarboxylic transport membrane protein